MPQTATALCATDFLRDELRRVIREPERELHPIRPIRTCSEVLGPPMAHSDAAVAIAATRFPPTARSAPRPR